MQPVLRFLLPAFSVVSVWAVPINLVPYASVGPNAIDFSDVAGAAFPGVNYDGILVAGGASFAERFAGQTLSFNGDLDVLSGTPTGPLTLQTGAPGQNLSVGTDSGTNGLYPYGPLGFPAADGYGEGAFAVLFPGSVSEFGAELLFGGSSDTFFQFFRADGSLIAAVAVNGVGTFGFEREGGVRDIAGVSVHTEDPGGLAYDNLRYGETETAVVPEPASLSTLGLLLIGWAAWRKKR